MKKTNQRTFCLLAALLAAGTALPAAAADMLWSSAALGGVQIHRKVTSMREAKFTDMVPQKTDYSCGAAALATILKYAYDQDVTEQGVIRGMMKVSNPVLVRQRGFSMLDMKHYAEDRGMQVKVYKLKAAQLHLLPVPVVALINLNGFAHFVVVARAEGNKVYLADPALGNRVMAQQEFAPLWNGLAFAIYGRGYNPHSALREGQAPLSARQFVNTFRPLPDAEMLDFGTIPAGLL